MAKKRIGDSKNYNFLKCEKCDEDEVKLVSINGTYGRRSIYCITCLERLIEKESNDGEEKER